MSNKLVWLRNDLRVHDHEAFAQAFQKLNKADGQVFALYCLCDKQWDEHHVALIRRQLVLNTLANLQLLLKDKGIALKIIDSKTFDQAADDVLTFVKERNCDQVFCAYEYPLNERRRDKKVSELLKAQKVELKAFHHSCLVAPGSVRKADESLYQVFTPFKRTALKQMSAYQSMLLPADDDWQQTLDEKLYEQNAQSNKKILESFLKHYQLQKQEFVQHNNSKAQTKLNNQQPAQSDLISLVSDEAKGKDVKENSYQWLAKEQDILKQLEYYCDQDLSEYHQQRDFPSIAGTSQLSAYLSLGSLSPRMAYHVAKQRDGQSEGFHIWLSELLWRDFYRHIVAYHPHVSKGLPYKLQYKNLPWQKSEAIFSAWRQGLTGYPLVDAAMRQLNQTGWMHNRLRMVVAMFLCKYALLDWRLGEKYFMQRLVDGDFAANNGGWQWSASTGTDAVPYFRLLSPVRQAQRFDQDAQFIKHYVPELAAYDAKDICKFKHEKWLNSDYPQPILDAKGAKDRASSLFKAHREQLDQ